MSKVRMCITMDQCVLKVLRARRDREGKAISEQIEEAIRDQLFTSQVREEVARAGRILQDVKGMLERVDASLAALRDELQELRDRQDRVEQWVRIVGFWGAMTVEFLKSRFYNLHIRPLTSDELERWKSRWKVLYENADERLAQLTGERVWKQKFDPAAPPSPQEKKK